MGLLWVLAQKMALVATIAYFLSNLPISHRLLDRPLTVKVRVGMVVVFGLFGILGTYTGVNVDDAIANNRVIGVAVGGLLGGPLVGLGAGLIAGVHRYFLGGFSALACGLSTALEGAFFGMIHHWKKGDLISWPQAFAAGAVAEAMQMVIILLAARPFAAAYRLVQAIAMPMILTNAAGIAIFVAIVHSIRHEQERRIARQAKRVLDIAEQTLPYLKQGLSYETAQPAAQIILSHSDVGAVAIADRHHVLAFAGAGAGHHLAGQGPTPGLTGETPPDGPVTRERPEFCDREDCPLSSSVAVPLFQGNRIVGSLTLYQTARRRITPVETELASGLAKLFSTQLDLAQLDYQARLAAKAEIKALQAQINPHFLFNALNTILCYIRRNPDLARSLVSRLGDYFRQNIDSTGDFVLLSREIEHLQSYLAIEEARFEDRLNISFSIEVDGAIPPMILQPLVENAVKHGLSPKKGRGNLSISATRNDEDMIITVEDDGVGMDANKLKILIDPSHDHDNIKGIGFHNVNERLAAIYGESYRPRIESAPGRGTRILLRFPLKKTG